MNLQKPAWELAGQGAVPEPDGALSRGCDSRQKPALLLAAPGSGHGKTMLASAMLHWLGEEYGRVASFKTGPDRIDPMFHESVTGRPSLNLDLFFSQPSALEAQWQRGLEAADMALVEGAMGIYDGLGGVSSQASAYHVAQVLDLPIALVVNVKGMGPSLLALLKGFLEYDTDKRIRGVWLNRCSPSLFALLAPRIEEELGILPLGYWPDMPQWHIPSRHLGLLRPEEVEGWLQMVQQASKVLGENIHREYFHALAATTRRILPLPPRPEVPSGGKLSIGVARDRAFCFSFRENWAALEEAGAELVFFSPLEDSLLPRVQGLWLGGGYIELYGRELEANAAMRAQIRGALEAGMPSVAEGGGFFYLQKQLLAEGDEPRDMLGVLPGQAFNAERLGRFGYITLKEKQGGAWTGDQGIRAHEFHYYDVEDAGSDCLAVKPLGGRRWEACVVGERHFWGLPMLYLPSCPDFSRHFLALCRRFSASGRV